MDQVVANKLNEAHNKEAVSTNRRRKDQEPLQIMDPVWYIRPDGSGDKLDSRWLGPGYVIAREGERSYVVEMKPGVTMKAHRSALKPYIRDPVEEYVPMCFHRRTVPDPEAAPDKWLLEKSLGHIR